VSGDARKVRRVPGFWGQTDSTRACEGEQAEKDSTQKVPNSTSERDSRPGLPIVPVAAAAIGAFICALLIWFCYELFYNYGRLDTLRVADR
jgi:hypothetical protein